MLENALNLSFFSIDTGTIIFVIINVFLWFFILKKLIKIIKINRTR